MNDFITWSNLLDYATFVGIVLAVVQVTKELPLIRKIPTRYWSILISFLLILLVNLRNGNFAYFDIVIYLISSMFVSISASGTYDFKSKPKNEESEESINE